ncbi:MAG: hypothetical protein ACFFBE_03855 [Promethearchaeota archaeon]
MKYIIEKSNIAIKSVDRKIILIIIVGKEKNRIGITNGDLFPILITTFSFRAVCLSPERYGMGKNTIKEGIIIQI